MANFQTTLQLYRDCLRVIRHLSNTKRSNYNGLLFHVRQEFKKHKNETEAEKIEKYRNDAVRALGNYMLSVAKDMKDSGELTKAVK